MLIQIQQRSYRVDEQLFLGETLNLGMCSKFWGNFEENLGNHGEIPHTGYKFKGSKGLIAVDVVCYCKSKADLYRILDCLDRFSRYSGLALNKH